MKTLLTLLAFYMLALQMMPCADMFGRELLGYSQNAVASVDSNTHDEAGDNDLCPPFCLCNCCGMISGILLHRNAFNLKKARSFAVELTTYYKPNFTPGYAGDIWQPPKFNA